MIPAKAVGPNYEARIRRAQYLVSRHPFAAEVLTFYGQLATFQKSLYGKIAKSYEGGAQPRGDGWRRWELKLAILLPNFPELLTLLEHAGPTPVANAANEIASRDSSEQIEMLTDFWSFGISARHEGTGNGLDKPLTQFVLRAFLQPFSEFVSGQMRMQPMQTTDRVCPLCGAPPLLGVLRPEGDGGKRGLVCSFCLHEWEFRRILCAACGEETEGKLPVYVAEQLPHIRVEACDTCKSYVRTIDLTKDGHAVPIVDDLGAIPLSLWAQEHGYTRLQENLLGT